MEGYLLIDKPKGWTSFDAVAKIRGVIKNETGKKIKVGHTGTLDPEATGLLVLCVGKTYTKKVAELVKHDKTYEAQITFGVTSTTGDADGILSNDSEQKTIERADLEKTLKKFIGVTEQVPPIYSAVKVNGKRAYELARAGKKVELKSRKIRVYDITVQDFSWPTAEIVCKVGSGTYIRVLAEDIGRELDVGAYLSRLRRTSVDKWSVNGAVTPKDITIDIIRKKLLA